MPMRLTILRHPYRAPEGEAIEMELDAHDAWLRFTDAVRRMKKDLDQRLKSHDVSLMEFRILSTLDKNGPTSMAKIADKLMVTKAGITLLTDRLEREKLVRRVRREGDRRLIYISLTAEGKKRTAAARKVYDAMIEEWMGLLDAKELKSLSSIVEKLSRGKEPQADLNLQAE